VSINEPQAPSHTTMLMPNSINEPLAFEMPDPPQIDSLSQNSAVSGDPDFTLFLTGTGFYQPSVIVFANHDEPTTLNEDGTLSTGVKPSLFAPATVQVQVRNGETLSNAVDFTFT
jgi:hypothetical protein